MLIDDSVDRPERIGFPYDPTLPDRVSRNWSVIASVGRCVGSWENYVYEVSLGQYPAILRLTDSRHRTLPQVTSELHWIQHLHANGVPVAMPLTSMSGKLSHSEDHGDLTFLASMFTRSTGIQPTPADCRAMGGEFLLQMGAIVAKLHTCAETFASSEVIDRPSLAADDLLRNAHSYVPRISEFLAIEIERTEKWIQARSKGRESFGLIHADLHGRNLLLDGTRVTVIDFDDCCFGWFAYDIAVAVNWAYPPDHPNWDRAVQTFLSGYADVRPHGACSVKDVLEFVRVRLVQDYILTLQRLSDPNYPHDWLESRANALEERLGFKKRAARLDS